jgi:hypothetical protein
MICFYLIFFVGSVLVDDWGQSTSLYQFMWKPKFSDIFFKGGESENLVPCVWKISDFLKI